MQGKERMSQADVLAESTKLIKGMLGDDPQQVLVQLSAYNELMSQYEAAISEVRTKLEILSKDLALRNYRNPIETVKSRIKRPMSIVEKLRRKGLDVDMHNITEAINDIAGIRVICSFIDDIYTVADLLGMQDDVTVIRVKDYIKNPKPNGYRSLHMIVEVPVFFTEHKQNMRVEVQIRTVAMDFWASLEHQLKYKKRVEDAERIAWELKECAEVIAATDEQMLRIKHEIDEME